MCQTLTFFRQSLDLRLSVNYFPGICFAFNGIQYRSIDQGLSHSVSWLNCPMFLANREWRCEWWEGIRVTFVCSVYLFFFFFAFVWLCSKVLTVREPQDVSLAREQCLWQAHPGGYRAEAWNGTWPCHWLTKTWDKWPRLHCVSVSPFVKLDLKTTLTRWNDVYGKLSASHFFIIGYLFNKW